MRHYDSEARAGWQPGDLTPGPSPAGRRVTAAAVADSAGGGGFTTEDTEDTEDTEGYGGHGGHRGKRRETEGNGKEWWTGAVADSAANPVAGIGLLTDAASCRFCRDSRFSSCRFCRKRNLTPGPSPARGGEVVADSAAVRHHDSAADFLLCRLPFLPHFTFVLTIRGATGGW